LNAQSSTPVIDPASDVVPDDSEDAIEIKVDYAPELVDNVEILVNMILVIIVVNFC